MAVIIGRSCRLPGAASVEEFWNLLNAGQCSVKPLDSSRWSLKKYQHPTKTMPGRTYAPAAALLDHIHDFDPSVFGISPREAEQMDPQQRLALELVWEALEDAAIPAKSIAGKDVGVFVGASALDHAGQFSADPASLDAYYATGNTLSIIANRISYIFDLHGPSFIIDTACSSALVAFHEAVEAIRSGRVETAVVVGVNILMGPLSFIGFSQANMLSPQGLCRAFDASADGYVRGEGGVALILQREDVAARQGQRSYAKIMASGINQDGRTVGMSLPSVEGQKALLQQVYTENNLNPDDVAFVEAHGTGTRVGDPIESLAIGDVLGQKRSAPLPIGSAKSNVGHLEPASGLVGLLKAMLALEHNLLPATLHVDTLNPDIDFNTLNLKVAQQPILLAPRSISARLAGVNSFGFGGTNAHVVLADPDAAVITPRFNAPVETHSNKPLVLALSAAKPEALQQRAAQFSNVLDKKSDTAVRTLAATALHCRDSLDQRAVFIGNTAHELAQATAAFGNGTESTALAHGQAAGDNLPTAFVYTGNGSQWAGMGQRFYAASATFRKKFDAIDVVFSKLSGWSLREKMQAKDLAAQLKRAEIAQPLIFALQSAATEALKVRGLVPHAVLGHSVGEIAAAEASGALSLDHAVAVIHARSVHQEIAFGSGTMAAARLSAEKARELIADSGCHDLEIAAVNSGQSVTVSGTRESIEKLAEFGKKQRTPVRILDLEYPFHSALIDGVREPLLASLANLEPHNSTIPFISTVTGTVMGGEKLDASYWWQNVREQVQFEASIKTALGLGMRAFIEIGPRAILQSYLRENLGEENIKGALLSCTDHDTPEGINPALKTLAHAFVAGAAIAKDAFVGAAPLTPAPLPHYPWQRTRFASHRSVEGHALFGAPEHEHPLIGERTQGDVPVWFADIDPHLVPYLRDHVVSGTIVVPGAALVEMALAAGCSLLNTEKIMVQDFEILHALTLDETATRTLQVRIAPESRVVEILSRQRLQTDGWTLHATGRIAALPTGATLPEAIDREAWAAMDWQNTQPLYKQAGALGLAFGSAFQRLQRVARQGNTLFTELAAHELPHKGYGLHPTDLDGAYQSLMALFADSAASENHNLVYLPTRMGQVRLFAAQRHVAYATVILNKHSTASILADFHLYDTDGNCVALVRGARFKAATLQKPFRLERVFLNTEWDTVASNDDAVIPSIEAVAQHIHDRGLTTSSPEASEAALLFDAFAVQAAGEALETLADQPDFTLEGLLASNKVHSSALPLYYTLMQHLENHQRLHKTASGTRLLSAEGGVDADLVLRTILADYPQHGTIALMANRMAKLLPEILANGVEQWEHTSPFSSATALHAQTSAPFAQESFDALTLTLENMLAAWPEHQPLRIVELGAGAGGLTHTLARYLDDPRLSITVTDPDPATVQRLTLHYSGHAGFCFQTFSLNDDAATSLPPHDMAVAGNSLSGLLRDAGSALALCNALNPDALLLAIEKQPSALQDLLHAADSHWLSASTVAELPIGQLRSVEDWAITLQQAGLAVHVAPLDGEEIPASFIVAQRPAVAETVIEKTTHERSFALLHSAPWADTLGSHLQEHGINADENASDLIYPIAFLKDNTVEALTETLEILRTLLPKAHDAGQRLWLLTRGAYGDASSPDAHNPMAAAVTGFARVAANEFKGLDLRVVDAVPGLDAEELCARFAAEIATPRADREIHIAEENIRVPRMRTRFPWEKNSADVPLNGNPLQGQKLSFGASAGLDELRWQSVDVPQPANDEVLIAVKATGLNFRDVMWAMGLLPEEALEDGFSGPTLGLEVAGIVEAVGANVTNVKAGDAVIAFSAGGFATHTITNAAAVAPLPNGLSFEAAATVPVAFITAWYALVELGRLKAGETVLIHGGAGGVGLAALQIALNRGATVIATAGNDEKRALLRSAGAHYVFNSRDTRFVDAVMDVTDGNGVDVVLNSLSGDAMEYSIGLVKPFGRFLELGKRDYYANTRIGLRPFRRNVSYFGIDADQLFAFDAERANGWFTDIVALFNEGSLTALPYRCFEAIDAIDAFRLMQKSGHVGKIIITPPEKLAHVRGEKRFTASAEGTHIITGGFSGLGLETAHWLADNGARHIALISRSGDTTPEGKDAVASLKAKGVNVAAIACDNADADALGKAFAGLRNTMPPIKGVIHAAMVLDDGLLMNLDAERFRNVMRPKIAGADNLDALTTDDALDYFVVYSSITTVIGNPGQANYVAANAYLESLMRKRRAAGKAGLAVGWGALGDVGYLARQKDVQDKLARKLGTYTLAASDALASLSVILANASLDAKEAAVFVAPLDWAAAQRELAILNTPTYAEILHDVDTTSLDCGDTVDLRALLAEKSSIEARTIVANLLGAEVAHILKLPSSDIDIQKPLMQLGMDSLMALELRLNVEKRFTIDLPLVSMSDQTTLFTLAAPIVSRVMNSDTYSEEDSTISDAENTLLSHHITEDMDAGDIDALRKAIQHNDGIRTQKAV